MSSAGLGLVAAAAVVVVGIRGWMSILPVRTGATRPGPPGTWGWRRQRAPNELDVAAWCDDLAREIRSGSSLATALRQCAAHDGIAAVVGPATARLDRGQSLSTALRSVTSDPSAPIGLALTALRSCADLGGPAASPLERAAATLRERDAIGQEQQSQSAQAQMSARVMTLVPIGMLALLALADAHVRGAIRTPPGLAAVTSGAALNAIGWWWMQRIIGRPR